MKFILPRPKDVVFLTIFIGVLILGNQMINADGDLPRHIATGRLILQTGKIPLHEPFVYPYLGNPYVPHEWLFSLLSYLVYRVMGVGGVVILSALLISVAFALLFNHLVQESRVRVWPFLLVILGASVSSLHWISRPHLFSMLFLVIWLIWLDRIRKGDRLQLWKFLLLMFVWANLHAEFIMGILSTCAFLAGWIWERFNEKCNEKEAGKHIAIILLTALPVTLLNPAGFQPWMRVFSYLGNDYLMAAINETNSPDFHRPEFMLLLGLIILSIVLLALRRNPLPKTEIILLAGTTWMTLTSARSVHLYGIVMPFTLLPVLEGFKYLNINSRIERNLAAIAEQLKPFFLWVSGSLLILAALSINQFLPIYRFDPQRFPVNAVRWMDEHPLEGNGFNDFDWGGYLELYADPGTRIFIDSMADHSGELSRDYFRIVGLEEGWQDLLEFYQIRWLILPTGSRLSIMIQSKEDWHRVYSDETAIILVQH